MSSPSEKRLFKVLCPLDGRDGKTHWAKVGIGFRNKDDSIGVVLDLLPTNKKLYIREWTDEDRQRDANQPRYRAEPRAGGLSPELSPYPSADQDLDEMPF